MIIPNPHLQQLQQLHSQNGYTDGIQIESVEYLLDNSLIEDATGPCHFRFLITVAGAAVLNDKTLTPRKP